MLWLCALSLFIIIYILDILINIDITHMYNAVLSSLNILFLANIIKVALQKRHLINKKANI